MRFAVCFTSPDFRTRQRLHEECQKITDATGWYPIVMGHRVKHERPVNPARQVAANVLVKRLVNRRFGKFQSLQSVSQSRVRSEGGKPKTGCSLLLEFQFCSVLLDLNFAFEPSAGVARRPDFAVLTHSHQDHSGGMTEVLESGVPVIVSESVYQQLLVLQPGVQSHEQLVATIQPTLRLSSEVDGTTFQFTPGAHSPGAMMVSITTSSGDRIVYPGDYCLRNRYYTESPDHLTSMFEGASGRKFLLVDSTFLKHGPSVPATLPDFEGTISGVRSANQTALFVADRADYLFAAYIWYFQTFYTGPKHNINRHLVAHDSVVKLIETTFEAFIRRQHENYDPFLKRMLGKTMHNYLESVRLYPFSNSRWPPNLDGAVDVFCPMFAIQSAIPHLSKPYALVLGRSRKAAQELKGLESLTLDGPDFSFHSAEEDVVKIVQSAIGAGVHPILFHNFREKIRDALSGHGISEPAFSVATPEPFLLR